MKLFNKCFSAILIIFVLSACSSQKQVYKEIDSTAKTTDNKVSRQSKDSVKDKLPIIDKPLSLQEPVKDSLKEMPKSIFEDISVLPVDDSGKDKSFYEFRKKLLMAIKEKNLNFIKEHLNKEVEYSFSGGGSSQDFIKKLNDELWSELKKATELGCVYYIENDRNKFIAPYTFVNFPESFDCFEYATVINKDTPIYEKDNMDSKIIEKISYKVIKLIEPDDGTFKNKAFTKIQLPNGILGYIESTNIRSPIDYRVSFSKISDTWVIDAFVSGD